MVKVTPAIDSLFSESLMFTFRTFNSIILRFMGPQSSKWVKSILWHLKIVWWTRDFGIERLGRTVYQDGRGYSRRWLAVSKIFNVDFQNLQEHHIAFYGSGIIRMSQKNLVASQDWLINSWFKYQATRQNTLSRWSRLLPPLTRCFQNLWCLLSEPSIASYCVLWVHNHQNESNQSCGISRLFDELVISVSSG